MSSYGLTRALQRFVPVRRRQATIGETRGSTENTTGSGEEVALDMPVMILGHPVLGAFPADDAETWKLG